MKKIVLLLSVLLVAPFLVPATAEARHGSHQRIISYQSCGAPVYQVHEFVGYDRCGRPVYRTFTRSGCRCRSHSHYRAPRHGGYCPPPRHHHPHHHSRGSISFFWSR